MTIYRVKYWSAIPLFVGSGLGEGKGWIDLRSVVAVDGDDALRAVEIVREHIMNSIDETCPKDAPFNTVRGFRLEEVTKITEVDFVESK